MKKKLLLPVLLLIVNFCYAANYYVSALSGNDSYSTLQAQNRATPWKSVAGLNQVMNQLAPGDSVLFERGGVYYGTLNIAANGMAGFPVYFGAYGSGANPVITGFTALTNWRLYAGNIHYAILDAPALLNMVTLNGVARGMGRHPNTGYLNYENCQTNVSIADYQLTSSPNWTGAEVVMRKYRFILDRYKITSHVDSTLFYSATTADGGPGYGWPVKGNGYFFQNHLNTLDQQGEWFYKAANDTLFMHFGGSSPAGFDVRASTVAINCEVKNASYVVIENLDFEGGNNRGLKLATAQNIIVRNCRFYNQGAHGIHAESVNNVTVEGGSVTTSFSNGIFFDLVENCTVDGVTVRHSNTIPGTGISSTGIGVGITMNGNANRVINNRIFNSGYNGIAFNGDKVLIERNLVDSFCLIKDDGGGIYSYTGDANTTAVERTVKDNIILNAIGAAAGAESYHWYENFGKAAGIYLDEHANHLQIIGNTVAGGNWAGIIFHKAHSNKVNGNLFFNHRYQVLVSQYIDARGNNFAGNNELKRNEFVAKTAVQNAFYFRTFIPGDRPSNMGTLDSNVYARPLNDTMPIKVDLDYDPGRASLTLTLAQWKALYGLDPASTTSPLTFTANIDDSLRFEYNDTHLPKTIHLIGSYRDMRGVPQSGALSLPPFSGIVLLKSRQLFKANQVIEFLPIAAKFTNDASFALTAAATSQLPVSYRVVSGPASVSGNMVVLTGAVGTVVVEATQAGNADFNAALPVTQSFSVALRKQAQTINFALLPDMPYTRAGITLSATSSSQLPVSYRIRGGWATVNGSLLTFDSLGRLFVEAFQPGNDSFLPAESVIRHFTVTKGNQTINFPPLANKTFGDPSFPVNATATSGLPVSFRLVAGPATLVGNTVTLTGTGEVWIEASQPGDTFFNIAPAQSRNFNVSVPATKLNQTITFPAIANKTLGDTPFALTATASSGLPVAYRVAAGPATVANNIVTLTGTGEVWIEASQAGNSLYNMAPSFSRNFFVSPSITPTKQSQTITFPAVSSKVYGDAPVVLAATASSGLPVAYRIVSGPGTVSGNTVIITGVGNIAVEATQAGNAGFHAAPSKTISFFVGKANQSITFNPLAGKTFGDPPFPLSATASSGLPVVFRVVSGPATIAGNTVTITGAGTVSIGASVAANPNYNQTAEVLQNFGVAKSSQTINFPAIPNKVVGEPAFSLAAAASSGLPVSYSVVSGPAIVNGSTVSFSGAGEVVIQAAQFGNANYLEAPPVLRSFTVTAATTTKQSQTISFPTLPAKRFGDAPFPLTATATSGLTVGFRVVSGPATLNGTTLTINGAGNVTVEASQPGNAAYHPAPALSQFLAVAKGNQSITFNGLPGKTFGDAAFDLAATATSALPVSYRLVSGPATVAGNRVSITGAGRVEIEASQAGNSNYNAAPAVVQAFDVAKAAQTITFAAVGSKLQTDAPFSLSATASSGLPVAFRLVSGPGTLNGTTVTLTGAGTLRIEALQDGNNNYTPATPVTQDIVVNPVNVNRLSQTITFASVPYKSYSSPAFALAATASSGLPVSFRVVSGPISLAGNVVTITGVGSVVVEGIQEGNAAYLPAPPVLRYFTIGKAAQSITFPTPPARLTTDGPFTLGATASSGLAVEYRIVSGPATAAGSLITLTGVAGTVVVEALQPGNEFYSNAYPLQRSFAVSGSVATKLPQTISFAALAGKTFGDAPFALTATASSGLPVSFSVKSGPATLSGATVTLTGAGTVVIEATQAGSSTYHPASSVEQSFVVNKAAQTISFAALPAKTFGDAPFALTATASSGLPVSFRITGGPASLSGNLLTITGPGTVSVEASQAGNANVNAAPVVVQSFQVGTPSTTKQSQTITFASIPYKNYLSPAFALTATATSGLPVSFRVVSGPVSLSGNTVTITGVGAAVIEAMQAGNATFQAAAPVQRSFSIGKAGQSITFPTPPARLTTDGPFTLGATTSSGLAVEYRIVSGPATASGSLITLTGVAGTVVVEASQPGNAFYSNAYPLQRSFVVSAPLLLTVLPALDKGRAGTGHETSPGNALPEMQAYPNPVRQSAPVAVIVRLFKRDNATLQLFDGQGRLVRRVVQRFFDSDLPYRFLIQTNGLRRGTYHLRLATGRAVVHQAIEVL